MPTWQLPIELQPAFGQELDLLLPRDLAVPCTGSRTRNKTVFCFPVWGGMLRYKQQCVF